MTEYLSEFANNFVGKNVASLDAAPEFDGYSGVEIIVSDKETDDDGNPIIQSYFAGDRTGRVLTIQNEWGTQEQANNILASIKGFRYQPYAATDALLDPAAELGDAVTISDMYSGIYKMSRTYNSLTAANIEAPTDKELDHEYPFDTSTDREYRREVANTKAQISLTNEAITAEVLRASAAEGTLSTRITQTANSITSEVTRAQAAEGNLSSKVQQTDTKITTEVTRAKAAESSIRSSLTQTAESINAEVSGKVSSQSGNSATFGWNLTNSEWRLYSNGQTVLKATNSELYINARINAKEGGTIGGFTIGETSIYKTKETRDDIENNGVYIGTDGIALGKGGFKVTSSGTLYAKSGFIGDGANGFTIGSTYIRNGMSSMSDTTHDGVYIGTGGIALGRGAFKVTSTGAVTASNLKITGGSIALGSNFKVDTAGNVTANNMRLTGNLTIGSSTITADQLRQGAQTAYNNSGTWSTGAGYGYNYNNATKTGTSNYPTSFTCGVLSARRGISSDGPNYLLGSTSITDLYLFSTRVRSHIISINGTAYTLLGF